MKPTNYLLIFFLVSSLELIGVIFKLEWLVLFTKPLLMPTLLVWAIFESRSQGIKLRMSIIVALIFSFLGDTFLLFDDQNEIFFLFGLGAFLVAQAAYAFTFFKDIHKPKAFSLIYLFVVLVLVSAYVIVFFYNLHSSLGSMKIPVIIYALAVSAMGMMSALRFRSVPNKSFYFVLLGAILFILSDTFIALDKFLFAGQLSFASIIIMSTYIVAQFLIVKGLLEKNR